MPEDSGAAASSTTATSTPDAGWPSEYRTRLEGVSKWAAVGLATVAGVAVTKLSIDRLGKGDLDRWSLILAYLGLVALAVGAGLIIAAVMYQTNAGRVTIGYMLECGETQTRLRRFFDANTYLLGGATSLTNYRLRLNYLVGLPELDESETAEFVRLSQAQQVILVTGARERARSVNDVVILMIVAGAILATLGAATFALATNRDLNRREDRLAKVVTGTLLPKTPSSVLLAVPPSMADAARKLIGVKCPVTSTNAVLLEIAAPDSNATGIQFGEPAVMHVVVEKTDTCAVTELWVPPAWILPRPEKPAAQTPKADAAPTGGSGQTDSGDSGVATTDGTTTNSGG